MLIDTKIIETTEAYSTAAALCQGWIRKITRHTYTLPEGFILKGTTKTSKDPVTCGGFADIYMGQHRGKEVALKVLRVRSQDKMFKVRQNFISWMRRVKLMYIRK